MPRRAEGPAPRDRLQHDPAAPLAVTLGQQAERGLHALPVVVRGRHQLLDGQGRAGHDEERLERPRELVERIGCD